MSSPLKLKSERVGKVTLAEQNPYLSVLVDTGVFHLDQEFDYTLPAKFDLQPGNWVSVPFHGRNCLGLIVKRSAKSEIAKVTSINRGVKGSFVSSEHLDLYRAVAARWATPIFDVLRFVTKYKGPASAQLTGQGEGKRSYLQLSQNKNEVESIKEIAAKLARKGSTLVIVPEVRLADLLQDESFDVAMRGAVLSPHKYSNLIVVREESEHHYEMKSPGFNTRDVALLRAQYLKENVLFVGYSPSLEMSKLIDTGFVTYKKGSGGVPVIARPSLQGELIPSALVKEFKAALSKGPVLVLAPSKGYGLAISCANCRNNAKCKCGGKLTKQSKTADPNCVLCNQSYPDWRCTFCKENKIYLQGRGIERIAEEFGKTFSNTAIHIATAEKSIEGEIPKRSIVLATVGVAPYLKYSALMVLDGLNSNSDMRNEERFLSTLYRYSSMVDGTVLVCERPEHPAINSLIRWNPSSWINRLLQEHEEAEIPPYARHILIKSNEAERIYTGLIAAVREDRLPATTRIHNLGDGVLSIFFSIKSAKNTLEFMYEFQRRRSMSGKSILKMRVDPYLLG